MQLQLPSRLVIVLTIVAACALAAGGYIVGANAGNESAQTAVPFTPSAQEPSQPIVVPSAVELPVR